nr:leucine-rich repeat domain-containing protein [Candidatus Sigynarchaeota archaeon]
MYNGRRADDVYIARHKRPPVKPRELIPVPSEEHTTKELQQIPASERHALDAIAATAGLDTISYFSQDIKTRTFDRRAIIRNGHVVALFILPDYYVIDPERSDSWDENGNPERDDVVYLANKRLGRLPPEIGNLQYLEVLDAHWNELASVPPELAKLRSLKELRISSNNLEAIDAPITKLVKLTNLDMSFNSIKAISPDIGILVDLERLKFGDSFDMGKPLRLPETIGNLVKLRYLSIENYPALDVPAAFGRLASLEEIDMYYVNVTRPDEMTTIINNLPSIKKAGLSHCNFSWSGKIKAKP